MCLICAKFVPLQFKNETAAKLPTFTGYSNDLFFRENFLNNGNTKMIFAKIFAKTNFREFSSNLKNFSKISQFH